MKLLYSYLVTSTEIIQIHLRVISGLSADITLRNGLCPNLSVHQGFRIESDHFGHHGTTDPAHWLRTVFCFDLPGMTLGKYLPAACAIS